MFAADAAEDADPAVVGAPGRSRRARAPSRPSRGSTRCCGSVSSASRRLMPKKARVELVDAVHDGPGVHEARLGRICAGCGQLGIRERPDRFDAVAEVRPELARRRRRPGSGPPCRRSRSARGPSPASHWPEPVLDRRSSRCRRKRVASRLRRSGRRRSVGQRHSRAWPRPPGSARRAALADADATGGVGGARVDPAVGEEARVAHRAPIPGTRRRPSWRPDRSYGCSDGRIECEARGAGTAASIWPAGSVTRSSNRRRNQRSLGTPARNSRIVRWLSVHTSSASCRGANGWSSRYRICSMWWRSNESIIGAGCRTRWTYSGAVEVRLGPAQRRRVQGVGGRLVDEDPRRDRLLESAIELLRVVRPSAVAALHATPWRRRRRALRPP